ncbi:putative inorganic phosphate cotransporter [Sitodiplosis mosellana]|uniref:putative inorganic phosphate cotransporter n=1 Tax=Sitodiplosis mosellana TaxID=263140 RepID=UPI002444B0A5|nr:putative inorganic phosphate cotransporter [Sitodiplosis mosellana]
MVQQRFVLATMMFLALGVTFAIRISFSLVLTQMVYIPNANANANNGTADPNGQQICPIKDESTSPNQTTSSVGDNSNRFQWSQQLQGIILSSFFLGYILSEIPGGILVQKYGGKLVLLITTFLSAIVVALTPFAVAHGEANGLIATRVLVGFLQGPLHPSLSSFGISWFPIEQRGRFNSMVFIGISAGSFISSYLAGIVIYQTGRWDMVFYGLSVVTAVWCLFFTFLCYEHPDEHPFIKDKEKSFLKDKTIGYLEADRKNVPPTPWKAIITNTPVIALLVCSGLYSWAYYVVNSDLPKYLNDVLHIPIQKNAVYSSVPRIANIFVSIFSGFISDWMYVHRGVSLTNIRKIFAALSSFIPSIFAIAASYAGCDELLVVTLLTISIAGQGFNSAGTILNLFDLGPNYIGPLNGIANSVSSIAALLAPYVVGILTPHAYLSEWRLVFWLTCALHLSKTVIFTIWGSAEVQPFNSP